MLGDKIGRKHCGVTTTQNRTEHRLCSKSLGSHSKHQILSRGFIGGKGEMEKTKSKY